MTEQTGEQKEESSVRDRSASGGRSAGWSASWSVFSQEFSMHAVRYVHQAKIAKLRRVVWQLLIFGAIVYFGFAASGFFHTYTKRLLSTRYSVEKVSSLVFPTITICNRNMWRRDVIVKSEEWRELMRDLYSEYNSPDDKYDWSQGVYAEIANMTVEETEALWLEARHITQGNTFAECSLFNEIVPCEDILIPVITDAGYCYQFNSNGNMSTTQPGLSGGVTFALSVDTYEYMYGYHSFSEGFSFNFHDWYEVPLVAELAIGVAPGTQAAITLGKYETRKYPPPADDGRADCHDATSLPNPLKYYKHYSYSGCLVECRTEYVIKHCGCRDHLQPELRDSRICLIPEMLHCSMPALRNFPTDPTGFASCKCPYPCVSTKYSTQTSEYEFPSDSFVVIQGTHHGVTDLAGLLQDLRLNYMYVDIFYGRISFEKLEEFRPYGVVDMIANVGGTLGLCLGLSILSVCEFTDFAIVQTLRSLYNRLTRSNRISASVPPPNNAISVIDINSN